MANKKNTSGFDAPAYGTMDPEGTKYETTKDGLVKKIPPKGYVVLPGGRIAKEPKKSK